MGKSAGAAETEKDRRIRRVIDVLGSAFLLLILSPLLAVIAAMKLTSLKFRTTYMNNDPKIQSRN